MPGLHSHFMTGSVHIDGIDTKTLLGCLLCRDDDCTIVLQRLVGRNRRFDDPLFLQFLPPQVFRDGMDQRQAEVAACDLCYGAGGGLEDAQTVAMPGCRIGFIYADRGRSPPPAGHKESAAYDGDAKANAIITSCNKS